MNLDDGTRSLQHHGQIVLDCCLRVRRADRSRNGGSVQRWQRVTLSSPRRKVGGRRNCTYKKFKFEWNSSGYWETILFVPKIPGEFAHFVFQVFCILRSSLLNFRFKVDTNGYQSGPFAADCCLWRNFALHSSASLVSHENGEQNSDNNSPTPSYCGQNAMDIRSLSQVWT